MPTYRSGCCRLGDSPNGHLGEVADVLGGVNLPDRGQAELVLQQHERDQGAEVGPRGQVPLPLALPVNLAAGRGVDQAAEPCGGVIDELDEPGVTGQRLPFADEDRDQVQVGPDRVHETGTQQLEEALQRHRCLVRRLGQPLEHLDGLIDERGQDRVLVREVAVDQRVVDVRRGREVAGGGGVEAALGEQGAGGGQDLAPPFGGRAPWPPGSGAQAGHVLIVQAQIVQGLTGHARHRARCRITESSHRPVAALSMPSGTQSTAPCGPIGECGWVTAQTIMTAVAVLVRAASTVRISVPLLGASAPTANAASQTAATGNRTTAGSARSDVANTPTLAAMASATGRRRGAAMARWAEREVSAIASML